ncbi:hypothetical protein VTL71DRAFT_4459 [Oculimacula yallundae]|uniref:Uncharacterized protein n=1 Tax=Oculimacula yallundae TaxID=86028 RepID=A0ABR4C235_9HELO
MRSISTTTIAMALSLALVVESITIPSVIIPNTDVHVQITGETYYATTNGFDTYGVYLLVKPQAADQVDENFLRSKLASCYLIQSSPISESEQTIQIPASIGPDERSYWISTTFFNESDVTVDKATGYRELNSSSSTMDVSSSDKVPASFSLQGGTEIWSNDELHGIGMNTLVQQDNVPCSSYDCARKCTATHYQYPLVDDPDFKNGKWPTFVEETYRCIQKCPGVTYIDIEELAKRRQEADNLRDGIITSTVLGPISTTSTKTIVSTFVSFQSISSAGTAVPTSFSNGTLTSASTFPTSTFSRIATPTIAPTPSPTSGASRNGLMGAIPLLGSVITMFVLLGF